MVEKWINTTEQGLQRQTLSMCLSDLCPKSIIMEKKKKGKNEQRSLTKRSKDRPFKKRYWSNSNPHAGKKKNLDTDLTPFIVMNSKRITVQM